MVVLTSGDRHRRDIATIDFDPKDRDGVGLGEIPHKIVYLCPKYVDDRTPAGVKEWLQVIEKSLSQEVNESEYTREEIQELIQAIREEDISPKELAKVIEEANQLALLRETREAIEQERAAAKALIEQERAAAAERERAAAEREKELLAQLEALRAQVDKSK